MGFADRFRFIWHDRRGRYPSSLPRDGDLPLGVQARDLERLLDLLGVHSAHVVTNSAGGPIVLYFATTRSQRVRSLALVGTGLALFPPGDPHRHTIEEQLPLLETQGQNAAYKCRPADEVEARGELEALRRRKKSATRGC
jgi:pimeloyl-ACP methyl ester carboxylesterase